MIPSVPSSVPRPTRTSVASFALIRREEGGLVQYLVQWNLHWRALNFVGGHKRDTESFRECLVREVHEELGLEEAIDYEIGEAIPLSFEAYSESAQELTAYELEVFPVTLTRPDALAKIAANDMNRWVTEAEALSGHCHDDGTRISPTVTRILRSIAEKEPGRR